MADVADEGSLGMRLRRRRFARFERLLSALPKPVRIIDVGGTWNFWRSMGYADNPDVHVTLVNLVRENVAASNMVSHAGNATDLHQFGDQSFDVAFSNSVIEHLFTDANQMAMAREVRRLAKAYWVQTPNYWFPIEPHFLFPGWQWLPEWLRVAILRRRACGWIGRCPEREVARSHVREVRLLSRRDVRRLFPDASMIAERFCGLVKSWTAAGGFHVDPRR